MSDNPEVNSFLYFSKIMEKISQISGRLEITDILSSYYSSIISKKKDDLIYVLYLCTHTIYPEYQNQQLNLGEKIIFDVLKESTGKTTQHLKSEYCKTGDFGTIGMTYRIKRLFISKKTLGVKDVVEGLRNISEINGVKSRTSKMRKMLDLISLCSPIEVKFMFRLFEENLKIKFRPKTVLTALAKVFDDSYMDKIKEAYNRRPDLEQLTKVILEKGISSLDSDFDIVPGIPLKPMLAQPTKNISSAFKRVENHKFTCENKYDGERIQIHRHNKKMTLYSRNLENTSDKYSDVIIKSNTDKDFVIDGEVVAYDPNLKKILSFQKLSTRRRKDFSKGEGVNICVFVFDILFFDGKELINKTLEERREVLYREFSEVEGQFYFSEHINCENIEEIDEFFKMSCSGNYEGIMIKILGEGSNYIPSLRCNSWIKLKKDYIDNASDSFDLVVIGAYYGKGKRTGWYGGFLLASYNEEDEIFETVCKIGTGFDDSTLNKLYEELNNFVVSTPSSVRYKDQTKPDVWISPKFVWEVKAAAVSVSPIYCCGLYEDKGYSLRFPRFLKEREDKKATDATTSNQIIMNYKEYEQEGKAGEEI
ncbi:DNA ligase 1 (DNLI1) [Vairimorpha necatrix]|uniref:DNA ligase n=1 Tax=Vairimorpha necatrix TaxID=6039 RepID=A0AAX4JGF4_9MICR